MKLRRQLLLIRIRADRRSAAYRFETRTLLNVSQRRRCDSREERGGGGVRHYLATLQSEAPWNAAAPHRPLIAAGRRGRRERG